MSLRLLGAIGLAVLVAGSASAGSPPADSLRAGAAASVITPRIGTVMNGGTAPATSTHVHDELYARTLVLTSGPERLAFVQIDNCLIDRPLMDVMKAQIHAATGLGSNQVCIAATHTHSAGSLTGVHLAEADDAYRAWIPGPVADSVRRALNNLSPAEVAWGQGSLPQHVFNRRIQLKPGVKYTNLLGQAGDAVKMNWSSPSAEDRDFAGPTDPQVSLLAVRHLDGRPLALLANYSLHYVGGTAPGHLSADYFGEFCVRITERLGVSRQDPPFVALLSNGTSGDINNIDFRKPRPQVPPYSQIRRVAEDLSVEVARLVGGLAYARSVPLRSLSAEVQIAVRKPTPAEVEVARGLLGGRAVGQLRSWTEIHARDQLLLTQYPDTLSLPIQMFHIGPLRVAQWPGEIFAESGLALKKFAAPAPLFNISLANGWFGYIPPPGQHALGSYETWRLRTSPLETNAIPRILDAFHQLLEPR
jgi:neutral ceramidase